MVDYHKSIGRVLVIWRWVLFVIIAADLLRGAGLYAFLGQLAGQAQVFKMLASDATATHALLGVTLLWFAVASFLILTVRAALVSIAVGLVDVVLGTVLVMTQKSLFAALVFSLPVFQFFLQSGIAGLVCTLLVTVLYPVLVVAKSGDAGIISQPFVFWYFAYIALAAVGGSCYDFFQKQYRQTQTLVSVVETNQELGSSVSEEKILSVVAQNVKKLFDCGTCVIYLRDLGHDNESVVRAAHSSTSRPDAFTDFNYDLKQSIIGQAIKNRKPMVLADFQQYAGEEAIRKEANFRSVMVAPLLFEDQALGAIFVAHGSSSSYQENHLRLFSLLVNQAALAVRNLQLHKTTATLAITDSLSGLFTHGYFQEHLARELIHIRNTTREPLSLMIIDVDFFKKVNDNYGHPQGDALLKQLGGLIKEVARADDVLCRYGGDEFTITMPRTNRIGAVVIAERLRETVENYEFVLGSQIVHVTVSAGVAAFPEDADTPKELVEKADRAMYEAKEKGRNRVCFSA